MIGPGGSTVALDPSGHHAQLGVEAGALAGFFGVDEGHAVALEVARHLWEAERADVASNRRSDSRRAFDRRCV